MAKVFQFEGPLIAMMVSELNSKLASQSLLGRSPTLMTEMVLAML